MESNGVIFSSILHLIGKPPWIPQDRPIRPNGMRYIADRKQMMIASIETKNVRL
jgi:hypothetical protein